MWKVLTFVALLACTKYASAAPGKPISHDEIIDSIRLVGHLLKATNDKLERHEYRERNLGEQLKKALSGLDRRERMQDTVLNEINTNIAYLGGRLQRIEETLKTQNEGQKGAYSVDSDSIQTWVPIVEGMIKNSMSHESDGTKEVLHTMVNEINENVNRLEKKVATLESNLDRSTNYFIDRYEQNMVHSERIQSNTELIMDTLKGIKGPSNTADVDVILRELSDMKMGFEESSISRLNEITTEVKQIQEGWDRAKEDIISKLDAYSNTVSNHNVQNDESKLDAQIATMTALEDMLSKAAANINETQRKVEYGVQQIVYEVTEMVHEQTKSINKVVNERFDNISGTILESQQGGLTNLSTKIETEISQVWRQIGIMYEQLTASASALQSLQKQTESYVNGSLKALDGMEGKVGEIDGKMIKVDEDLNYFLGRLSLVAQEFQMTKGDLENALQGIKDTFQSVQKKMTEVKLGKNSIDSAEKADNYNTI